MSRRARVTLPALAAPVDQLWHVLLDIAENHRIDRTLIGGQMVLLHALEHGEVPPQVSQDGDIVANVRAAPAALTALVDGLTASGFTLARVSPDNLAHRYERHAAPRPIVIDVLAPEGLGANADLTTTPPGRTIEVPGGTQALRRTERVEVAHEGRVGVVPRPSLLGAIVIKAAACGVPGDKTRHLRDLALLCALVDDPFALADDLTGKDRQRIRLAAALLVPSAPAWMLLPPHLAGRGHPRLSSASRLRAAACGRVASDSGVHRLVTCRPSAPNAVLSVARALTRSTPR